MKHGITITGTGETQGAAEADAVARAIGNCTTAVAAGAGVNAAVRGMSAEAQRQLAVSVVSALASQGGLDVCRAMANVIAAIEEQHRR